MRLVDSPTGSPRYLMWETIREYAEEQLASSEDDERARRRHAAWCVEFVKDVPTSMRHGSHAAELGRLEDERENFRAALRWAEESGDTSTLLILVSRLGTFWYLTGREPEGLEWHRRALARARDDRSPESVEVMIRAGHLAHTLGDAAARDVVVEGQELARAIGDIALQASAAIILGIIAEDEGDYGEAEAHLSSAQELARQADLRWVHATARYHLGIAAYGRGEREQARALLREARQMALTVEALLLPIWTDAYLILIACEEGDLQLAGSLLREAHQIQRAANFLSSDSNLRGAVAVFAGALDEWEAAARLLGSAMAEFHDVPFPLPERVALEATEDLARQHLGPDAYAQAWAAGHKMRRRAVATEVERLLAIEEGRRTGEPGKEDHSILTPRELEVLRLLIAGKSNREIAEALFISPRTATTHVTNILAKFGVETRAAAVTYAFQHDLA